MPPLRDTDFTDLMAKAGKSLGWNPFRGPAAINSQDYRGRPACAYHGYCDRGGCHVNAKNSTAVTTIPAAQKFKNFSIFDNAQVTRIQGQTNNGKTTGVLYIRNGKEYFQPGQGRAGRILRLRERAPAAAVEVQSVSQRLIEQSRPGGKASLRTLE